MKKLYAIIISLLFMASTFGVAQTMAKEYKLCDGCVGSEFDPRTIESITVQVGDTLIVNGSPNVYCPPPEWNFCQCMCISGDCGSGVEVITFDCGPVIWETHHDPEGSSQRGYAVFKAVRPGTVTLQFLCMNYDTSTGACPEKIVTVTVTPKKKPLPMDWILKKFGLGKYKNN